MKKIILTLVLAFSFATIVDSNASNLNDFNHNAEDEFIFLADCFGEAIGVLEAFEAENGPTTDDEATYILNMAYAICWAFE